MDSGSDTACRLCGGCSVEQFRLEILRRYDVGFTRCDRCGSLQTERTPHWLDEAYSDQRRFFDTGAVIRNQKLLALAWLLRWAFRLPDSATALDWGGSDGLYTRMLRDIGFDAYHSDKYAENKYAAGFDDDPDRHYNFISAFEVYEHLPNPAEIVAEIFAREPDLHLVSTQLYTGQGAAWQYIWPTTGRHVFFFSPEAMRYIGETYGYSVMQLGECTLFHRLPLDAFRRAVLKRSVTTRGGRLTHAAFALRRGVGRSASDREMFRRLDEQADAPLASHAHESR